MVGCISIDGEDYTVYENGYCPGANELGSGDYSGDTACAAAFCTGVSSCTGFEYATNAESPSCFASTSCTATDMVYYDGFNLAMKGCSLPEVQGCLLINGKNYTKISNGGCSGLNELGDGVYADPTACESAKCSGTQCSSFEIDTVSGQCYASTGCNALNGLNLFPSWDLYAFGCASDPVRRGACVTLDSNSYTEWPSAGCIGKNEKGSGVYASPEACVAALCSGASCSSVEFDWATGQCYASTTCTDTVGMEGFIGWTLFVLTCSEVVATEVPSMVGCTSIDGEDYTVYQDGYCPGANELGSGDHNSATTCAAAFCTGQSSCVAFEWSASGSPSCYASTSCTATDMAYEAGWSLVIKGCDLPTKGSCETINGKNYTKISNGGCTGLNELGDGVYADPTACESARCTGTQCSSFEIHTASGQCYASTACNALNGMNYFPSWDLYTFGCATTPVREDACVALDGNDYTAWPSAGCIARNEKGSGVYASREACVAALCSGASCSSVEFETATGQCYASTTCTDTVGMDGFTGWTLYVLTCTSTAAPVSANGDPHLSFAHGGIAHFRGADHGVFNFLSAPNVSFNIETEDATYSTAFSNRTINGSFMVTATWAIRTTGGQMVFVAYNARTPDRAHAWIGRPGRPDDGYLVAAKGWLPVMKADESGQYHHGPGSVYQVLTKPRLFTADEVTVSMSKPRYLKVLTAGWEFQVRQHVWYPHHLHPRLSLSVRPTYDIESPKSLNPGVKSLKSPRATVAPHGLIGQSWDGDQIAISGRTDDYYSVPAGHTFTTSAQAEGAIEGSYRDYQMSSPFATAFRYSRFDAKVPTPPRNASALGGARSKRVQQAGGYARASSVPRNQVTRGHRRRRPRSKKAKRPTTKLTTTKLTTTKLTTTITMLSEEA